MKSIGQAELADAHIRCDMAIDQSSIHWWQNTDW